jgi:hypothetical protein
MERDQIDKLTEKWLRDAAVLDESNSHWAAMVIRRHVAELLAIVGEG